MANQVIIVGEEFLKRIFVGLGELPSKFAHAVILDLEAQIKMHEDDPKAFLSLVDTSLAEAKSKVAAVAKEFDADVLAAL